MDYATLENVEVECGEDAEGRTSSPAKNSSHYYLSFRLLMSRNSEGRTEQMCLVAESRYCCFQLPTAMKYRKMTKKYQKIFQWDSITLGIEIDCRNKSVALSLLVI